MTVTKKAFSIYLLGAFSSVPVDATVFDPRVWLAGGRVYPYTIVTILLTYQNLALVEHKAALMVR